MEAIGGCRGCVGEGGRSLISGREGSGATVSQWVMLLLLLNPTPSPEQREVWRAKAPAPLAPLICIGHSAPPPTP